MRIGMFTEVYTPYINGVTTSIDVLRKALEKEGHEVFIVAINHNKNGGYERKGNVIHIPGVKIGIYDFKARLTPPIKAIKMIKELNLDIIHVHNEFMIGRLGKYMGKKLNIPVIHTFHTLYEKSMHYITKGYFPKLSVKVGVGFMKTYLNSVKYVIAPTIKTEQSLRNIYNYKGDITIIPTGINLDKFYKENHKETDVKKLKESLGIKEDDLIISYVGRLGVEKKIDVLVKGHKEISEYYPKAKLLIIGPGPEEENLRKIAKEKNIEDKVIFTGRVQYEEIGLYYQIPDILATASDYETQGLTLVEALAASKPVVCLDDDSFKDVITEGFNGKFFKTKEEYIEVIKGLINNPKHLEYITNNARGSSAKYSAESFASEILKLYHKALINKEK